ncbi:hypothetical protein [Anaeromyxobacter oryzae]|uniref:Uncharacterized protein n=1 Tax=Anaeromyxobacter oryzae TaxID=2918170 RepID=A0ABM7WV83_9BACT|nr:hypothetical protein [Anaeromyxobacter oryzae]BDG03414.1 hypothetical protein AMOR_24100 [Anaeromyxobacter oryzae]
MTRRSFILAIAATVLFAAAPARADVPLHVRVIKGSRQGPPKMDPRLEPLKRQLSPLAYVSWQQTDERKLTLAKGRTEFVPLPDGDTAGITVQEERGNTVTIEVALAQRNTQSRLTIERGQRIVHQVTAEKNGTAFFLTVAAWP